MKLAMLIDPSNPSAPRVIDLETREPVVLAPGNYDVQVVVSPASTEEVVSDPVPLPLWWRARGNKLLLSLEQAATIIESAADAIESFDDDDIDGECAGARADAKSFRQEVADTRAVLDLIEHAKLAPLAPSPALPLMWLARVNKLLLCLEKASPIIDSAVDAFDDTTDDSIRETWATWAAARADAESFRLEVAKTRNWLALVEQARSGRRSSVAAGPRDLVDREVLGRVVRETWVTWAAEQPDVAEHPSWLVPWDGLPERDRDVDRRIGEACALKLLRVLGFK